MRSGTVPQVSVAHLTYVHQFGTFDMVRRNRHELLRSHATLHRHPATADTYHHKHE